MNSSFIIIVITILFNKIILSSISDEIDHNDKVIEITTKEQFTSYVNSNEAFILDIYLPKCSHCIIFSSHYKKLASIYQDTLPFLKINGKLNKSIYQDYITVNVYPTVLLYDHGSFYKYNGINEVEFIYEWIEKKNDFTCHEIPSKNEVINLLSDNVINENGFHESFILGIFDKHPNTEDLIDIFINLTRENRMYVSQCKYFIYDFNGNDKDTIPLLRHNFIYSYNYQKGINTFSLFDQINLNQELKEAKIEIAREYELFLLNNWMKLTEDYNDYAMNDIFLWEGVFIIFSYPSSLKREFYEEISRKYITSKDYDKRVKILFVNLQKEYKWNYHVFCKEEGIYLAKSLFSIIKKIDVETNSLSYKSIIEVLNLKEDFKEEIKQLTREKKSQTEISRFIKAKLIKENNLETVKLLNKKNNDTSFTKNNTYLKTKDNEGFLQESIVKKDSGEAIDIKTDIIKKEHMNTQIIIFPVYIMIYSLLFALGYRQYYIYYPTKDEEIKIV